MINNKLLFAIGFAAFAVVVVSTTMLALAYHGAVAELEKMRGDRDAVSEVDKFIERVRPALDPATRRGMAEFLIEASIEHRIPYQVLANVGYVESRFTPTAVGDGGKSHGMYQVQGFWVIDVDDVSGVRYVCRLIERDYPINNSYAKRVPVAP